jgi:polyribonucleotide nucleotidyltransferase
MKKETYTLEWGGKTLIAEFTDLAENASGSVLVRYGETAVFVTAVMGKEKEGVDYFPLSVEFEERFYAAGQILGSRFVRREGRPSEGAILSARIIDRTIRPLFPDYIRNDVQIVATVLAMGDEDPAVVGVLGASLALGVSSIPWGGPIGAARIGIASDGTMHENPSYTTREGLRGDVLACGREGTINMVEVGAREVDETTIEHALTHASTLHTEAVAWQEGIVRERGKEKILLTAPHIPEEVTKVFMEHIEPKLTDAVFGHGASKVGIHALKEVWKTVAKEQLPDAKKGDIERIFERGVESAMDSGILDRQQRPDGRGMSELRLLYAQAGGVSPVLHGSGIFYRGGTHMFSALTLGSPDDSQLIDTMEEQETKKRFMHHYNFPPFSVGETGRVGGFNRRMIGHGALAEKALEPVIPQKEQFPYTIRLVSETLSSNGSSSMGSVCASTLALMDGGVPITKPVAGIASGVIYESAARYQLLTDIQGPEDQYGDMDFKVAGTRDGITAIQMDVKTLGIPVVILREALERAKDARHVILDVMEKEIRAPRPDISPRAPKILVMTIDPKKIGLVIGSGGKTINKIKEETLVDEISIEDDGTIYITGSHDAAKSAYERIEAMTHEFTQGEVLTGKVTRLAVFGAFVALNPYTEGLLHISEIAPFRLEKVDGILSVGDEVTVVVKATEEDKVSLSIKMHDPEWAAKRGITPQSRPAHNGAPSRPPHDRPRR